MHLAMAVTFIVLPIALIVVLRGVDHLAVAPLHAALPLTRVNGAVLVAELTVAVSHALLPVTLVLDALFLVDVGALTVAEAIENVTLVSAAIWPGVVTLSSDLVLFEFTGVDRAIRPLKDAAAPEKTQVQLALILMPIFKLACTVAVVDIADLKILQS